MEPIASWLLQLMKVGIMNHVKHVIHVNRLVSLHNDWAKCSSHINQWRRQQNDFEMKRLLVTFSWCTTCTHKFDEIDPYIFLMKMYTTPTPLRVDWLLTKTLNFKLPISTNETSKPTWPRDTKSKSTYMAFTFLVSQQKLLRYKEPLLKSLDHSRNPKKTVPPFFSSFFFSRFTSPNSSVRKFWPPKKVPWRCKWRPGCSSGWRWVVCCSTKTAFIDAFRLRNWDEFMYRAKFAKAPKFQSTGKKTSRGRQKETRMQGRNLPWN